MEGAFGDYKAEKVAFVVPGDDSTQDGEAAASGGAGEEAHAGDDHAAGDEGHEVLVKWDDPNIDPILKDKLKIFFGIYYCMTGLHGIHVLLGILVFMWLLSRAMRGHFTPTYYGPIDYAALYWHLVDLIWIYLFPLLYLIN